MMALTEQEAEAIRADHQAGLSYRKIAKKYHKAQRDIRDALLGSASSSASKSATGSPAKPPAPVAVPPELPMVTVPLSPKQEWRPTSPKGIKWIFIGSFHVTSEVIDLYNFWLAEFNPDMAFDEFVSEAVKGFFQLNGIVPAVYVEGGSYGAAGVQSEPAITRPGEKRVATPGGEQRGSGPQ